MVTINSIALKNLFRSIKSAAGADAARVIDDISIFITLIAFMFGFCRG
jgi:hypothetical protein